MGVMDWDKGIAMAMMKGSWASYGTYGGDGSSPSLRKSACYGFMVFSAELLLLSFGAGASMDGLLGSSARKCTSSAFKVQYLCSVD